MQYKVPFVDYGKQYLEELKPYLDYAFHKVMSAGDLILRKDVEVFEKRLAKFVGTKYAVGVGNGTDALMLSLKAAGIKSGDEVITSAHTFFATLEAIVNNGAKPVLIDTDLDDLLLKEEDIESKITPNTKAILPVHLAGNVCNMDLIMNIALKHNLIVIEDACQGLGAVKNPRGLAQCWSFFPAKILGSYGDAGAITTNDEEVYKKVRALRNHNMVKEKGSMLFYGTGFNSRLDNLQAAFLNIKLDFIKKHLKRRNKIARIYDTGLAGVGDIKTPNQRETYQDYIILTQKRDELCEYLKKQGIETLKDEYVFPPEYEIPENTKVVGQTALRLPIAPILNNSQINYVVKKIREFSSR
jgi:dTDP-4-amino-4,6-dideoxygalactose transaminase